MAGPDPELRLRGLSRIKRGIQVVDVRNDTSPRCAGWPFEARLTTWDSRENGDGRESGVQENDAQD
jgi:hypothetical protein